MKDLNLLAVFDAMWRNRSVTAAADSLGVTQAAVSSSLKRLREEYDDRLFTLVGRAMEPTPLARALAPQLLEALRLIREARSFRPRFDPATDRRVFNLRMRDAGEAICMPLIVERLAQQAPEVRLRWSFKPPAETLSALASGRVDIAMGSLSTSPSGIYSRSLATQRYVCVVNANHPLAQRDISIQDLRVSDHLLVEPVDAAHQILEKAMRELGVGKRIRVRLPHSVSAPYFLVNSSLIWSTTSLLAQQMVKFFPLVIRDHPMSIPAFDISMYWHERFHQDPANSWLRSFFVDVFEEIRSR